MRDTMPKRVVPFSPPDITEAEIQEVVAALRSGWITTGPRTKLLERRLAAFIETGRVDIDCADETYANRVVCLNSATAAEELNLRVLGIGPGDEVIVPAYTYTATVSAVLHCGATPVAVDCVSPDGNAETHAPTMDPAQVAAAINERTKAIIAVDLGGIVCDYAPLFHIAEENRALFRPMQAGTDPLSQLAARIQRSLGRVAVIADAAHALGASRIVEDQTLRCGQLADFTSFSFHAVKNFTTAEGGASTWRPLDGIDNAELYKMYQLLSLHGQNKDALAKTKSGGWEYDIIGPWYKCNLTDLAAAIGLRQLDRYPALLARRQAIIARYDDACDVLGVHHLLHSTAQQTGSGHLYLARVPGIADAARTEIIGRLAEHGVAANVHYKPLPRMTAYRNLGWDIRNFPNADAYFQNLISLPLHTRLSDADVDYVIAQWNAVLADCVK